MLVAVCDHLLHVTVLCANIWKEHKRFLVDLRKLIKYQLWLNAINFRWEDTE